MADKKDSDCQAGWLAVLEDRFPGGVLLVERDGEVIRASSTARQMLEAITDETLRLTVPRLLDSFTDGDHAAYRPGRNGGALAVERHPLPDGAGWLLLLQDPSRLWGPDSERLLANRMRGLHTIHRAMGHDLKSSLHAIALTLDLLRELIQRSELEDDPRERARGYLDVVQAELSSLERSVQTLLAQVNLKDDGQGHVDMRRVQREVVSLIESWAGTKSVQVRSTAPAGAVSVLGSRDRLRQAILNVAFNAVAAIEASGRGGQLEFDLRTERLNAVLEIRDDGPGLFGDGQTGAPEPTHASSDTGSGIGLDAARWIMRAHEGELSVRPRTPRGTVVRLTLPLRAPEANGEA